MKDKKAMKHLKKLGKYCNNPKRELCYGCVFENIRYENRCPIAVALQHCERKDNWIYKNPYPEYDELFKAIEAALGFKLFVWQKSFIVMCRFRQYGETTARILRELLELKSEPLDYTMPPQGIKEEAYRQEFRKIYEKLKNEGIETREVFWSVADKRRYTKEKNVTQNPPKPRKR